MCELSMESDVRERLGKLPESLEQTYSEIFHGRIGAERGNGQRLAHQAMMWVMCSGRPLSPDELVAASVIALRLSSDPSKAEGAGVDIDVILKLCHNLVVVDNQLNVVRFAHLSVQEFLEVNGWDAILTNSMAAEVCLSFLLEPEKWAVDPPENSQLKDLNGPHLGLQISTTAERHSEINPKLLSYLSCYWPTHVNLCGDGTNSPGVRSLLSKFLGSFETPSQVFVGWYTFVSAARGESPPNWPADARLDLGSKPLSILPTVCYFGFGEIMATCWDSDQAFDSDMKNEQSVTLLGLASGQGHEWIVRALITRGADVNHEIGPYGSPLQYASGRGHNGVVQILLDNSANINFEGGRSATPLRAAALNGNERVVRTLLERGGDNGIGWAFGGAAAYGHKAVLCTMIEHGVDTWHGGWIMRDACRWATDEGQVEIVKFLLSVVKSKVDDIRQLSSLGSYIVAAATRMSRLEIIRLVYEELPGVDLDTPTTVWGKTPLHHAIEIRSVPMANYLISHGANIRSLRNLPSEGRDWAQNESWFHDLQSFLDDARDGPAFTLLDVLQTRLILRKGTKLPVNLIDSILDMGEYWVRTRCSRQELLTISEHDIPHPYVQLLIRSHLQSPVRKIVFFIRSHDQGNYSSYPVLTCLTNCGIYSTKVGVG